MRMCVCAVSWVCVGSRGLCIYVVVSRAPLGYVSGVLGHVCVRVHARVHVCACVCMRMCMRVHAHVCVCAVSWVCVGSRGLCIYVVVSRAPLGYVSGVLGHVCVLCHVCVCACVCRCVYVVF